MKRLNLLFALLVLTSAQAFGITANKVYRVPSGGSIPSWGPVNLADGTNAVTGQLPTANIADGAITVPKLSAINIQRSSAIASFTHATSTLTKVTNSDVSITTTGNPVELFIEPATTGTASGVITKVVSGTSGGRQADWTIYRDGVEVTGRIQTSMTLDGSAPISSISFGMPLRWVNTPPAGTYTYSLYVRTTGATAEAEIVNAKLVALELR
jgi:hypothetical protein